MVVVESFACFLTPFAICQEFHPHTAFVLCSLLIDIYFSLNFLNVKKVHLLIDHAKYSAKLNKNEYIIIPYYSSYMYIPQALLTAQVQEQHEQGQRRATSKHLHAGAQLL